MKETKQQPDNGVKLVDPDGEMLEQSWEEIEWLTSGMKHDRDGSIGTVRSLAVRVNGTTAARQCSKTYQPCFHLRIIFEAFN